MDLEDRVARMERAVVALSHVIAHHPDVLAPKSFAEKEMTILDEWIVSIETPSAPAQTTSDRDKV